MIHQTELEAKLQEPFLIGGNYLIFSDSREETPKISDRVKGRCGPPPPRSQRPAHSLLVNVTAYTVFIGIILLIAWFA